MDISDLITAGTCQSTTGGYIWYCDECQTHGNADSGEEANYMIHAHSYWVGFPDTCLGCSFVVNVKTNTTYPFGAIYTKDKPLKPSNLVDMLEAKKRLGLQ
jgi:hypothetical protein